MGTSLKNRKPKPSNTPESQLLFDIINVRNGSSPAGRRVCRQRLSLRAKLPLGPNTGESRTGRPESTRIGTFTAPGPKARV